MAVASQPVGPAFHFPARVRVSFTPMNASSAPSTDTARRLVHAADIQAAQARISSVIAATPLQFCPRLSELTGARVFLKS